MIQTMERRDSVWKRKVLEDRGYIASLDLDDSDYGEPDSIVIVTEENILKGEI